MRAFVIDDEGSDGYVVNVVDLLRCRKVETEHLQTVSEARSRLSEIVKSDLIVLDLMMPETDEGREIPEDPTEVGVGFLMDLIKARFSGRVAVLTNATRERHGSQISWIESLTGASSAVITVSFKYIDSPMQFVFKILPEVVGGP